MEKLDDSVLDRFKRCQEADGDNRKRASQADKFSAGLDQWEDELRKDRQDDRRPCLTMDETNQYINQVKNDQRQNRASIKVRPVDDKADKKTAEMLQGVIRHIEDTSSADIAYDTAFEQALRGGFGYFRIATERCDEMSFEQDIKIVRIRNRFSVYLDPDHQEPDGSDCKYGFITEWISREDFKAKYPKADPVDFKAAKDKARDWVKNDKIQIAEYFFIESETKTLVKLPDGDTLFSDEIPKEIDISGLKTRETEISKVKWQKITAMEVLEDTLWPGKHIPIIEVIGNEFDDEGERKLTGIVHAAMDAQRMHNYAVSSFVENVALAPRAPFIAAAGQVDQYKDQWEAANRKNIPVLPYTPIDNNGVPVPPPIRMPAPGLSSGWDYVIQASRTWVQAAMGMYAASIGAEGQEKSGKAIIARQREGDVATFHYHDNLSRSIRHAGRILVDIIPKIYNTKRVVRILGEDGSPSQVMFYPNLEVSMKQVKKQDGSIMELYNPTIGKYDVTISTGPSYSTKRQEASETQMQIIQAAPELFPIIGDIFIRNTDMPGADQIADRLKAMLPEQIRTLEEDKGSPQDPEKVRKMVVQAQQALKLVEQKAIALQEAEQQISAERSEVETLKAEVSGEIKELNAVKRVLAAEKSAMESQIRLAQNESSYDEDGTIKRYEADMKYKAELAKAAAEVIKSQIVEREHLNEPMEHQGEPEQDRLEMVMEMLHDAVLRMSAPKQIIYDEGGNAVGIQSMHNIN